MSTPETTKTPPDAVAPTGKKTRQRSPSYPFINLEQAVKLAGVVWEKEKRHPVTIPVVSGHWEYGGKSSTGALSVAALKKFGLLDEEGSGDKRTVKLSQFAIDLIKHADMPEERAKLLKIAALKPDLHRELWTTHRDASDSSIRRFLIFDRKFNESAVDTVIEEYRDTIAFANLKDSDTVIDTENDTGETAHHPDSEKKTHQVTPAIPESKGEKPPPAPPAPPGLIEIPVPLPSGVIAYYRVPPTMTGPDFDFYHTLWNAYRAGLVKTPTHPPSEN